MDKEYTWKLNQGYIKCLLIIFLTILLSSCGIAYHYPAVNEGGNVRIIPLTLEVVLEANSSPYEPKKLPDIFSKIAENESHQSGYDTSLRQASSLKKLTSDIEAHLPKLSQPQPYIIGVGDVVMLSTPTARNDIEALNVILASQNKRQGYTVQDDGAISIPDIGRVVIGGLRLQEAEDAISQMLVEEGLANSFSIEVAEFNSQKVSVVGAVVSPGIEPITLQPLYLDQVISLRGGIAINDSSFVIIQLYRNSSIYELSVAELYNQDSSFRILLRDADRVVVKMTDDYDDSLGLRQQARAKALVDTRNEMWARSDASDSFLARLNYGAIVREYVYVIGEVGFQTRFSLPFENKAVLADALVESGGIMPLSGNIKQIYILRRTSDPREFASIKALHLDASNAANFLLATQLELRPADVIFVGTQPITNWNRVFSQIMPSLELSNMNIPTSP